MLREDLRHDRCYFCMAMTMKVCRRPTRDYLPKHMVQQIYKSFLERDTVCVTIHARSRAYLVG
jgi:hypothetical protein